MAVLYGLDFDGVLCDSADETALSGTKAAFDMWGEKGGQSGDAPKWLLRAMRSCRPAIHSGWENVIMARVLFNGGENGVDSLVSSFLDGQWESKRDECMADWSVEKDELVKAFGGARDKWIEADREGWVRANRFYPGVIDALNFAEADVFIITTKERRFVDLLLEANNVTKVPGDRIFAFGCGTKISTLKKILAMPVAKGKTLEFVEDRYETIEAASLSLLGLPLRFYLAGWGYNTEARRDEASKHPFIDCIELNDFVNKLQ